MCLAATPHADIKADRGFWSANRCCCLAAIVAVLTGQPGVADASEADNQARSVARNVGASIDQFVSGYIGGRNFSGTILVARGDEVLINRGYGMADYEQAVPNTASTRYLIGSVSKSFTAAAIRLLQERGRLDLDDSVARFIPGYPRGDEIRIRHLLDHTSGLPRIVFFPDFRERSQRHHTARELVEWIQDKPLVSPPGQEYGYSNANYALLAYIIERVSGTRYSDYLRTNIFDRLELNDTGDRGSASSSIEGLASGYTPVGRIGLARSRDFDYSIFTGAGSLYSTTSDLFRWYQARRRDELSNGDTRARVRQAGGGRWDFGWNSENRLGREALVMRGWDGVGFSAHFIHYPAEDVTVIVLCNLNMSSIASEIAENVSAIAFGESRQTIEVLPKPPVDRQVLLDMEGRYRFGPDFYVPNTILRIAASDGQLVVPANEFGPEGSLLAVSDRLFIHRQQWITVQFNYSADGTVTGITYGNFQARKEQD